VERLRTEIEDGTAAERAWGELDVIDGELQSAFDRILDSVERIGAELETLDSAVAVPIEEAISELLEASAVRDIVGQRLVAVRLAVDHLVAGRGKSESSVERNRDNTSKIGEKLETGSTSESGLLNGPQMPGKAKSQTEVDALFDNLD